MRIAIIGGGGYIGTALCLHWKKKGHFITATTKNPIKLKKLSTIIQKTRLMDGGNLAEVKELLKENDLIVVALSANYHHYEKTFLPVAHTIKQAVSETPTTKHLLYISNGIVYGDHKGLWVDETSSLIPQTEEAKILIETENIIHSLAESGWKITQFRLGQIYGPGRSLQQKLKALQTHIISGRENYFSNMIHQADVVGALDYAMYHMLTGTYNVADDDHPTKKEMFDKLSALLHLPKIRWSSQFDTIDNGNMRMSNHKIKSHGYSFIHPHRIYE